MGMFGPSYENFSVPAGVLAQSDIQSMPFKRRPLWHIIPSEALCVPPTTLYYKLTRPVRRVFRRLTTGTSIVIDGKVLREMDQFMVRVQIGAYRDAPPRAVYYYLLRIPSSYQSNLVPHSVLVDCVLDGVRDFVFGRSRRNFALDTLWWVAQGPATSNELERAPSTNPVARAEHFGGTPA